MPAPGPPPCGNQLRPEGESEGAVLLLRHSPWGTAQHSARGLQRLDSGLTRWGHGTKSQGQTGHRGRALGPGAGPGMPLQGGVYEASASLLWHARTWDRSHAPCQSRNQLPAEAPGQVLTDPALPMSPPQTGSGQNYG